jgi:quinol monooxygenase YgiN
MVLSTVVAHVIAKPEKADLLKAELQKLIPLTGEEKGSIQYDMHTDNEQAHKFLFYEVWESRELFMAHMESPRIYVVATRHYNHINY